METQLHFGKSDRMKQRWEEKGEKDDKQLT